VNWIDGAKRAPTREQRLATTVEWLGEGKHMMWKYERR
jgi:bacteriocin resistance YdeI/OmpD-like protein